MPVRTILVADDSSGVADVLDSLFGPLGFRVVYVPNGRTALTVARAARPDLIIADVTLRVLTGIEFVRELKRDMDFGQVPVILCSALYQPQEIDNLAYGCGPFAAWNKFDSPDRLLSLVENLMSPGENPSTDL